MQIMGIIILVILGGGILFLRNKINTGNNPYLKTALKINDAYVWFRFIGGIILVIFILFIVAIFAKKH